MFDETKSYTVQRYRFSDETCYAIEVKHHLDPHWQDWFPDLEFIQTEDGRTILRGVIVDQAALHGVLKKIRDLGLHLISINPSQQQGE